MEKCALESLAPKTGRTYQRAYTEFQTFLASRPPTGVAEVCPESVREYLFAKHRSGVAVSTLKAHAAAISFFEQVRERPDPCRSYLTQRILAGWARSERRQGDSRKPITLELLGALLKRLPTVCYSKYEVALFRAAFTTTFFGAFRYGEVVAPSRQGDGGFHLRDLHLSSSVMELHLRRSKNDQLGKGTRVRLLAAPASGLCPVALMHRYLAFRGYAPGRLFQHRDGSSLSRYQFAAVLKKVLIAQGCRAQDYGTHSFRIGAASVAAAHGLDDEHVKAVGRWRSGAFRGYIRSLV